MIFASRSSAWPALLVLTILCALVVGCTDRRPKFDETTISPGVSSPLNMIAQVQFQGLPTSANQMVISGDSLYLTGQPFFFAKWDLSVDPQNPYLIFAARNDYTAFSQLGFWSPDNFAAGALDIMGGLALMTGFAGLSAVTTSQFPVEVGRYPSQLIGGVVPARDPNFIYQGLIHHPQLPILYGFAEQDFIYTLRVDGNSVTLAEKAAYGSQNVCCAMGAAAVGNRAIVAMRGSLWTFDMGSDGRLQNPTRNDAFQAVNVVATEQFIYVQHRPTSQTPPGAPTAEGIYVFDHSGQSVTFLPISPVSFAVYRDRYLYANVDDTSVNIYLLQ